MTWLTDEVPQGEVVLDASAIINILGTGCAVEVFQALGHKCLVEERTLKEVLRHPDPRLSVEDVLDDLQRLGLLEQVRMDDNEYGVFLDKVGSTLPRQLDAGESAAIAIASRGACVAIDEKKARKRLLEEGSSLKVVSTLRLLIAAAARAGWPESRARELVVQAKAVARMGVPKEEGELLQRILGN